MAFGDVDTDFNFLEFVPRDGVGDGRGQELGRLRVQLEHGHVVDAEELGFERVPQHQGHVLDQAGRFWCGDGRGQHSIHEGHGLAASPRFALQQAVPAKAKVAGVRRGTGPVGHARGQIDPVAAHQDGSSHDVLLNLARGVAELIDIDGHLTLQDPCLGEGFSMRSIVVSNDHINFTGGQTAHGEAPLYGGRERHGEDAGFLRDFTPAG